MLAVLIFFNIQLPAVLWRGRNFSEPIQICYTFFCLLLAFISWIGFYSRSYCRLYVFGCCYVLGIFFVKYRFTLAPVLFYAQEVTKLAT